MSTSNTPLPEAQLGPAEKLLDTVLSSGAHLWHNRLGLNQGGTWRPLPVSRGQVPPAVRAGTALRPGLFVPAAVALYTRLIEIYKLNAELSAHFASYALVSTEWRDLKVACAALMLVQGRAGAPVLDGGEVAFYDDDFRAVGEGMVRFYERKSSRMMTPKAVLRVAELLEVPQIAALNRQAGFGDPAGRKPFLGRWPKAARAWLEVREQNVDMLEGLVKAGYKETIKKIARKAGYRPRSPLFFEVLGWRQKQAEGGHRQVGLTGLNLRKRERFDGLTEAEICEWIESERLSYKDVVGRLPRDMGLTPAIMVAVLPSLSDRDLRLLTPTLEGLGLLSEPQIRARWERAIAASTDQRALNIVKNVRGKEIREKLEEAADNAAKKAVAEAVKDADLRLMFLIDKSGSMQGAIEQSKEALSRIAAGFPLDKVHIATFDTIGTVLVPKAQSRAAIQHMLAKVTATGGTIHGAAVRSLHNAGVRVPPEAQLVVIVVGDEAGEDGARFAQVFRDLGYQVAAMALIVSVANHTGRGETVRRCAGVLGVPFSEVQVAQFDDPYQVPRVLEALLQAPKAMTAPVAAKAAKVVNWVEKVMQTPLLQRDGTLPKDPAQGSTPVKTA